MNRPSASRGVLLLLLFGVACGGAQQETKTPTQSEAAPVPAGRIRGVVRFQGTPPAPAIQPITKDSNICGTNVSLTRLAIGKDNGVRRTFVYLDDAGRGQQPGPKVSVLVDQKNCEYAPRALTVAAGTSLDILNSDPILHNVHAFEATPEGLQTIFNIAQPIRGQRTTVNPPLMKPGIVVLSCEAGHPWMSAYIFVADHPYVAVTDDDGEFVVDGVPAGTYRIKMWHEGVRLKRIIESLQRYEYEDPYESTQQVVVTPGGEAVINFDLALRAS